MRLGAPGRGGPRLNRTSVGLKLATRLLREAGADLGLNRTSVGLKPLRTGRALAGMPPPQSNQRGIETAELGVQGVDAHDASIEPAWD